MTGSVAVVGSLNVDLTLYVPRMPRPGETVAGTAFAVHPGGKSANQAVAASRLGADVRLVGAVGYDAYGTMLLASAEDAAAAQAFEGAAVVCLCLEVPQETVLAAARSGRAAGASVILNLSPFAEISRELVDHVDVLLVHVHEAAQLLGRPGLKAGEHDAGELAAAFAAAGYDRVIVTLGAAGALVLETAGGDGPVVERIAPTVVRAIDTTGAEDAFTGALAARLAGGDGLVAAARYASAAAVLATTRHGTQAAYAEATEISSSLG